MSLHQGGRRCFSAGRASFAGGARLRHKLLVFFFLHQGLCESVISLIFSALRDPAAPPHLATAAALLLHHPVSFLPALFVFGAHRILLSASFSAAATLAAISLLSPSTFPLPLILVAPCHTCSCITSFDNLADWESCAGVSSKKKKHLLEVIWQLRSRQQHIAALSILQELVSVPHFQQRLVNSSLLLFP